MILALGLTFTKIALATLFVSITLLILIILFKRMVRVRGKGTPKKEQFAVLFGLETKLNTGILEFYFAIEQPKAILFSILDSKMNHLITVVEKDYPSGGHIVRFDTSSLENGVYFYCLQSENQKTMKRMVVLHDKLAVKEVVANDLQTENK